MRPARCAAGRNFNAVSATVSRRPSWEIEFKPPYRTALLFIHACSIGLSRAVSLAMNAFLGCAGRFLVLRMYLMKPGKTH
jgi:hypothetical protein